MSYKTVMEPFRIKMVEPIGMRSEAERRELLKKAHYNLFAIHAADITIDLLTDSGTGAMSAAQWAAMINGDESYAGARSFYEFEEVTRDLTGMRFIFPTHQGRASEHILFAILGGKGKSFPSNSHFDTTRANIEYTGSEAVDLLIAEGRDPESEHPFKGNMDTQKLEKFIGERGASNIPLCFLTITNNSCGGQPVSMENIRATKMICKKNGIPLFLDACRFAENAYFIKLREVGYTTKSITEIVREMFSYADGFTMSAKKDGFANIGGILATNNADWAHKFCDYEILTEGFPTYGGLAGRDLSAIAQGLREIVDENYLQYRLATNRYLGKALLAAGIPIIQPVGGHAVYINARKMLPHISPEQLPGQALACELYGAGGIRTAEIGSLMFGGKDPRTGLPRHAIMELVRLAIPRRVYTQSHIDYVIEVLQRVNSEKSQLRGLKIIEQPTYLRHFTAKLQPLN